MVAAASEIILFGKRGSQAWPVAKVSRDPLLGEVLIYVSKNTSARNSILRRGGASSSGRSSVERAL
ncbi:hypothetical protein [Pseudomonas extremaustralis]|uniref:hypothetical protein n=1 Tax=Pseudomonas extremaustralis TaxID=359110 RepID=UPI0012387479|nr:hypothetical protein [Pseudomonas extremaustralis]